MNKGYYLSAEAFSEAQRLFATVRDNPKLARQEAERILNVSKSDWSSFDELYLALYCMALTGKHHASRHENDGPSEGLRKRMSLRLLIDRDLPNVTRESTFEETLVDEFLVADLINLRARIEELVPYQTTLSEFGTGCIFLEFNIYASDEGPKGPLPEMTRSFIESSPAWNSVRDRFSISELELNSE